ncbi:MAG: hypothetical protein ABWY93_04720 [Mycobacterium sp.]
MATDVLDVLEQAVALLHESLTAGRWAGGGSWEVGTCLEQWLREVADEARDHEQLYRSAVGFRSPSRFLAYVYRHPIALAQAILDVEAQP